MPESLVLVIVGGIWLTIGVVLSVLMGRRGHSGFSWLVLGTLLGPLAVILAFDAWLHGEAIEPEVIRREGAGMPRQGPVDVLVGYDGSPESMAALNAVPAILGERLGRLTVATVARYDDGREAERHCQEFLRRLADDLPRTPAATRGAPRPTGQGPP